MGFIAAVLSKAGYDVSLELLRMLRASSSLRADSYGVASQEGAQTMTSLPRCIGWGSEAMLGHRLEKVMPLDPPQPVHQGDHAFVFEGRLWRSAGPDIEAAADILREDPPGGIRRLISQDGSFAIATAYNGKIFCGRDPLGVVPLYWGETESSVGLSSNMKALWCLGMRPGTVPPGSMMELSSEGVKMQRVGSIKQPPITDLPLEEAVGVLDRRLGEAVEARSRGVSSASLGFSGGIDSTLLAHYLDRCGVDLGLVCVGLEGSAEFNSAERAAGALDLPLRVESFCEDSVEEALEAVLMSVEEPDPLKVGVSIPLYWAASRAAEAGNRIIYSGNGSDELFGGYMKYVREYLSRGDSVRRTMFGDVVSSHGMNYERDHKICGDLGLELRLPFTDLDLTRFGLSLPLGFKLPNREGGQRKAILRALARRLGLPEDVASRPKRAVQYSTGVSRALRRIARRRGLSLRGYLEARFEEAKGRLMDRVAEQ